MKTGIELIAEERNRQITKENWTTEHDDEHDKMELALAAECYISAAQGMPQSDMWPWDRQSYKPSGSIDPMKDLIRAGALIAAEIDRLQRLNSKKK